MDQKRRKLLLGAPALFIPSALLRSDEEAPLVAEKKPVTEITEESRIAVGKGNKWLRRAFNRDGSFGIDIGQPPDIGCTAVVGLSLLAQGNTLLEGPHSAMLKDMTGYLLRCIDAMPSDDITSAMNTQLQRKIGRHAHSFFAATFLAQVLGQGWADEQIRPALGKLLATIAKMQTPNGSWAGEAWAPVLGQVMGWISLRAGNNAGYKVEGSAIKVADYLVKLMEKNIGDRGGGWMMTLYKNATGVRVLHTMGRDKEKIAKDALQGVFQLVTRDMQAFTNAGGEEYLAFHLITETLLQRGGDEWGRWFPVVRDKMIKTQNADGSWTGKHCITSRVFCTAAAILVLSAPNRYLPISQ